MSIVLEFPFLFYMNVQTYFNFLMISLDIHILPEGTPLGHLYGDRLFLVVLDFFSTLNNFSNFFAYVISGKKFRKLTLQTLKCK